VGPGARSALLGADLGSLRPTAPLIIGASIGAVASLACALAPNVEILIAARFIQAVASSAAVVMSRAIIGDLAKGFGAARTMTLMMSITSMTPVIAPAAGAFLAGELSWRWVLGCIAMVNVVQVIVVLVVIPETLQARARRATLRFGDLGMVARRRAFRFYCIVQFFQTGTMMGYVSSSSFLFQDIVGVSPQVFGVLFGVNATFLVLAGVTNSKLAGRRIHPARTVAKAQPVILAGSVALLALSLLHIHWLIPVPIFFVVAAAGFVFGNVATLAQEQSRPVIGAGSAVFGAFNFLGGGLVAMLGGLASESPIPLGILMTCCSLCSIAAFRAARRTVADNPALEAAFAAAPAGL